MIKFNNVTLGYGKDIILENLNFEIKEKEFVGLIGQNGSGKTTIFKAITGILKPIKGEVVKDSKVKIGYVIQRQHLDTIFPFTVEEVVLMGRYKTIGVLKPITKEDRQKVLETLDLVGISELKDKHYRDLSGGQRQRVLIARALVGEPNVLLLDEPTNNLDVKGEEQVLKLVEKLHIKLGLTIILISHTLLTVLNYVDRVFFLKDKRLKQYTVKEIFSEEVLSQIYEYPLKIGVVHNRKYIVPGDIDDGDI